MAEDDATRQRVRQILQEFKGRKSALLVALLHVQYEFGYIPEFAVEEAASTLEVSQPEVWGVLTFYADFKIGKQGDHFIDVCIDSACHLEGAPRIRQALEELASRRNDGPSLQVRAISCPRLCAKAPVVAIDLRYHAQMTPEKAVELASQLS